MRFIHGSPCGWGCGSSAPAAAAVGGDLSKGVQDIVHRVPAAAGDCIIFTEVHTLLCSQLRHCPLTAVGVTADHRPQPHLCGACASICCLSWHLLRLSTGESLGGESLGGESLGGAWVSAGSHSRNAPLDGRHEPRNPLLQVPPSDAPQPGDTAPLNCCTLLKDPKPLGFTIHIRPALGHPG